jgi:hypothetical protein
VLLTPAGRPAGRAAGRAMDTVLPCHDPGEPFGDSSTCTAMHRRADDRQDTRSGLWPVHACSNGRTRSPRRRPVTSGSHLSEWTRRGSCSACPDRRHGARAGVGTRLNLHHHRSQSARRTGQIRTDRRGDGQVRTDRGKGWRQVRTDRGKGWRQVRTNCRGWAGSDRSPRERAGSDRSPRGRRGRFGPIAAEERGRFGPIVGGVVRVSGLVGAVVVPWFEGILR